ncbi:hypothetical protein JW887_04315 [Candidatus Dojkabacteria bacterium]|nr:hypothetical protein [Candidatus Dojkabacteria bacterium]
MKSNEVSNPISKSVNKKRHSNTVLFVVSSLVLILLAVSIVLDILSSSFFIENAQGLNVDHVVTQVSTKEEEFKYRYLIKVVNYGPLSVRCSENFIINAKDKNGNVKMSSVQSGTVFPLFYSLTFDVQAKDAPYFIDEGGIYTIETVCQSYDKDVIWNRETVINDEFSHVESKYNPFEFVHVYPIDRNGVSVWIKVFLFVMSIPFVIVSAASIISSKKGKAANK